jgi:leucyl aminopeptidase
MDEMRIRVSSSDLSRLKADLAVCFAFEGDKQPRGIEHDPLRRELAAQMRTESFEGRPGDPLVWNANGRYPARRFLIFGLGTLRESMADAVRLGCARAARAAARFSARSLAIRLPDGKSHAEIEARAAVEGSLLGAYQFDRYLTDPTRRNVKLNTIELAVSGAGGAVRSAVNRAGVGVKAVCLARDLVNEGPSRLTPAVMATIAAKEARAAGLQCQVLGPAELRKKKFHALLAVSRGSQEAPRVVHLIYKPTPGKPKQRLVLVGKGVTFDSGGLNLKPGSAMLTMKADMAGAAAVLATMTALKAIDCPLEVHGLLGLCENMTGSGAYKPGDILDTLAGKTVEIGNTDAEGRLVLCDLLAYAVTRLKPTRMVDVATLTGACVVALGPLAAGLFTRHDDLGRELLEAARDAGEKLWSMPLYDEYLQLLQKGPADLSNVGGKSGGAITAALFLGEFVPRELPWAHLDIAGPAFVENELAEAPVGATGAGVMTLLRWIERA